jgi:hypothetical protein
MSSFCALRTHGAHFCQASSGACAKFAAKPIPRGALCAAHGALAFAERLGNFFVRHPVHRHLHDCLVFDGEHLERPLNQIIALQSLGHLVRRRLI